jgi:two-component system sensor histidine kinase DegS
MHDGPAQSLSNLVLQAEVCERLLDKDPSQIRTELKNLKNAVNTTFQKTRSFIFDLRPMMLDDLGLVPTLKRYVEELEIKSGLQTSLNVIGSEARFESHTEVIVFRAVQVLLDNVIKHAQASHAQVTLDILDDGISVTVEDDGSGFNVDEALQRAEVQKVSGLTNVMDQVKMLGGTVDIDSEVGRGTVVGFSIPVG